MTAGGIWSLGRIVSHRGPAKTAWLEERLAEAVAANKNTLLPAQLDEAALRWCTAERLTAPPQIAILGSSHSLQINSDFVSPFLVSNFSISGGSLADHLITTQILNARRLTPKICLILVDPWYFDRETDFLMWTARPQQLVAMETRLSELSTPPLPPLFRDRVAGLAKPKLQASYSLDPLLSEANQFIQRQFTHLVFTGRNEALGTVLLSDGSIQAAGHHRDIDLGEARALALRQFDSNRDRHRYGNFTAVDPVLWEIFERWIRALQADGSRVVLMLPPYHPAIYPGIIREGKNQLRTIEERIHTTATALQLRLIGSYDPKLIGVTDADFFDGDHLREDALARLLSDSLREVAKEAGLADPPPAAPTPNATTTPPLPASETPTPTATPPPASP